MPGVWGSRRGREPSLGMDQEPAAFGGGQDASTHLRGTWGHVCLPGCRSSIPRDHGRVACAAHRCPCWLPSLPAPARTLPRGTAPAALGLGQMASPLPGEDGSFSFLLLLVFPRIWLPWLPELLLTLGWGGCSPLQPAPPTPMHTAPQHRPWPHAPDPRGTTGAPCRDACFGGRPVMGGREEVGRCPPTKVSPGIRGAAACCLGV